MRLEYSQITDTLIMSDDGVRSALMQSDISYYQLNENIIFGVSLKDDKIVQYHLLHFFKRVDYGDIIEISNLTLEQVMHCKIITYDDLQKKHVYNKLTNV